MAMTAQAMLTTLQAAGMKDAEIASAINVSQPTVTRIRNGINDAKLDTYLRLSEFFAAQQALHLTSTPDSP